MRCSRAMPQQVLEGFFDLTAKEAQLIWCGSPGKGSGHKVKTAPEDTPEDTAPVIVELTQMSVGGGQRVFPGLRFGIDEESPSSVQIPSVISQATDIAPLRCASNKGLAQAALKVGLQR